MTPLTLDEAWAEVEAALPEGAHLSMGGPFRGPNYHVAAYAAETRSVEGRADIAPYGVQVTVNGGAAEFSIWLGSGDGPTPAAALQALAARLREPAHTAAKGKTT